MSRLIKKNINKIVRGEIYKIYESVFLCVCLNEKSSKFTFLVQNKINQISCVNHSFSKKIPEKN